MAEEGAGGQPADHPLRILVDGEECTAISGKDSVMFKKDDVQVWGFLLSTIQPGCIGTFRSSKACP